MSAFRRVIHEVHRRSLWQVLSIYLVGSWVALQVVESLTESAGLPDWVPSFALVLLLIGLPIVMATAFVQEGMGGGGEAAESEAPDAAPATAGGVAEATPGASMAAGDPAAGASRAGA
ncbi:MAG: hypothetical protein GWM92_00535, partial [Gemmatimonadetes bacterium]|nr:hypothetical protein [Gemmatimonadota bacterium]NIR76926.1 hypothetical protein [Gemmatimonadota bacterium]NIT85457.1 hypothetical protein [Gemmatimonadota bacterium]NIU29270.1 hypothetical protein [Gemmatimonadota bacterium]NIU34351.1 hypothetical protein [Gemmatimonadota bacterium]